MTGYGRGEVTSQGIRFVVEIKTVNHRFQELVLRLPQGWMSVEEAVKKVVQPVVRRGRADVFVHVEGVGKPPCSLSVDWGLVDLIVQSATEMAPRYGIKTPPTAAELLQLPGVLKIEETRFDPQALEEPLLEAVGLACKALATMRKREGEALYRDLVDRSENLKRYGNEIRERAPQVIQAFRERLERRMEEWLEREAGWMDRITGEAALFADKADIEEELTRLGSHIDQLGVVLLHSNEPIGRQLDFLLQEMNREVNTIGSKANDAKIGAFVVECKSELEKMREQVQNIE
ncbi:TIGR00255 family protein [Marininema mesophilum]|uniref:TIGR00255 family protein n=2 Tax=Marininema mesophilum TaxID=1048340 RepID=A0A1H2Q629_9BACL|nr:TIGR00255 family protein [Marininema mesophilum]